MLEEDPDFLLKTPVNCHPELTFQKAFMFRYCPNSFVARLLHGGRILRALDWKGRVLKSNYY